MTPGYTVGILQQEPPLDDTKTVGENIKMAFGEIAGKGGSFQSDWRRDGQSGCRFRCFDGWMGKLQNDIDAANGWDLDSQLEQAMMLCGAGSGYSGNGMLGGERRHYLALCKLLLEAPDLLLLDEPTNHLDAESILWLEQVLHQYKEVPASSPCRSLLHEITWPSGSARSTVANCTRRIRTTTPRILETRPSVWKCGAQDAKARQAPEERT